VNLLWVLLLAVPGLLSLNDNSLRNELKLAGERAMLNGHWDEARYFYDKLCRDYPHLPDGYLHLAVLLQTEMTDREEIFQVEQFRKLLDKAESLADSNLKVCSRSDSAYYFLYKGHTHACRAVWETRFGSTFSAITYGFKAKGAYQKGLECDSTLYDLYLGIGSYHYWKTAKSGVLKTFGIFKDDRERGISELILARDSSQFSRQGANSTLMYVFLNEKKYDSALALAQTMHKEYPRGNHFLWPIAESLTGLERYAEAAVIYDTLLERLWQQPGNYFNIVEVTHLYFKAMEKADRKKETRPRLKQLEKAMRDIPRETIRRQRGKLTYLKRYF
jgi:tetratricopeptide (TPR) repeat protein